MVDNFHLATRTYKNVIFSYQEYGEGRRTMCLWYEPERFKSMVHQETSEVLP